MAITISIGMEKGGVGKTTTAAILSYLLSKQGKVLAIDMDAQGDLSHFLSRKRKGTFEGKSVYNACLAKEAGSCIHKLTDSLDLLPADDELMLMQANNELDYTVLEPVIKSISDNYDYIIIDMPPQLGLPVLAGLYVSDLTIIATLAEPLSYQKLDDYLEVIKEMQKQIPTLQLAGILITSFDPRTAIDIVCQQTMEHFYSSSLLKTVIKKRTHIKAFSLTGITERTKADREALEPYKALVKELIVIGEKK